MKCFNRNVLLWLAAAGVAVFLVAPSAASAAVPLLIAVACPLAMVVMMRMSSGARCRRDDAEADARRPGTVVAAEAEIARLRAEIDQLRAEEADLRAESGAQDGAALEGPR